MKKFFGSLIIAVLALVVMTGGAWATSTIDICPVTTPVVFDVDVTGTTAGAATVDQLWVQTADLDGASGVDFGNSAAWPGAAAGDRDIAYYSDVALSDSSTLRFDVTGGAIKADATLFLLAWDMGLGAYETVATLNDFGTDSNGNYTWIRMQIDTTSIAGGETFADSTGAALAGANAGILPAGAVCVLSKGDHTAYDGIQLAVNQNATSVTIAVGDAKDNNSNPLTAPLAAAETIINVISGVSASIVSEGTAAVVASPAGSTIDVNAATPRTLFVDDSGAKTLVGATVVAAPNGGDTDTAISEAGVLLANTAEFGLTLNAGDTFNMTLKRSDVTGVTGVQVSGNAATAGTNEWTYTNNFGAVNLQTAPGTAVSIAVSGTSVLKRGTWTIDLSIDPDQDAGEPSDLPSMTLLTDASSHIWGINGAQFVMPHLISRNNYESYIYFKTDAGAQDALIFVDMLAADATKSAVTLDETDLAKLTLPSAANGGSRFITATELLGAAGWATGTADNDFIATFTVTLPQSQVFCEGFKYNKTTTDMNKMTVYENKTVGIDSSDVETDKFVK